MKILLIVLLAVSLAVGQTQDTTCTPRPDGSYLCSPNVINKKQLGIGVAAAVAIVVVMTVIHRHRHHKKEAKK